jgi:hypothetical protein
MDMKQVILALLAVVVAGVVGLAALRLTGRPLYLTEMMAAALPCLVASGGAVTLASLYRRDGQAAVVQGAYQGMIVHLAGNAMLAVAVGWMTHVLLKPAFAFWLLWFYWSSLSVVAGLLIHLIRRTPIAAGGAGQL